MNHRKDWVWSVADKEGYGLEIGPLDVGLAPRRDGYRTRIMDYVDQVTLKEMFKENPARDISKIEEVDFLNDGRSLDELAGKSTYDHIIACNVIEHVPDLISFLKGAEKALRPGGVLCLIAPDMRYCFDHFDFPTTLSEVWRAHALQESKPNFVTVFQHFANHSMKEMPSGKKMGWNRNASGALTLTRSESFSLKRAEWCRESDEYVNVHVWAFLPSTLRLLLMDLFTLGFIHLAEVEFSKTVGCEFFIALKIAEKKPSFERIALLEQAKEEALEAYRH